MDWDEFVRRGEARRRKRQEREARRAERTAHIVLFASIPLAFFIVLQWTWGWMA